MKADIRAYSDTYWEELRELIRSEWREDHPLLDHDLFEWQYRGYGSLADQESISRLLFVNNELVGFLGCIPGLYQIFDSKKCRIVPGAALALWFVHSKYRGSGLGILLMNEVERIIKVLVVLGAGQQVAKYYLSKDYQHLRLLRRYVIPLDINGYIMLQGQPSSQHEIKLWLEKIRFAEPLPPVQPNSERFEQIWIEGSKKTAVFGLCRTAEFWKWRYCSDVGYSYEIFGGALDCGLIVARVETIFCPGDEARDGNKVLRIIEIIPPASRADGWNDQFVDLLAGVLSWGREQGCWAADFQCTSRGHSSLLSKVGFRPQGQGYKPPSASLAGLFRPLRFTPSPINALWKISDPELTIEADNTYLVKSDGDQDRPNIA